jgi:methylenetetrahydrofolate dehydrogenase (NADP+) / methenyltetrahydrofolate cyclohydrolase
MILRGDKLAKKINSKTKTEIKKLKLKPGLAAILVGNNSASKLYVSIKKEEAKKTGINFYEYHFSEKIKESEILNIVDLLNKDKNIHGIIVQLPLPKNFNTDKIIQSIDPKKDVDGFHGENTKKLLANKPFVVSPLIAGSIELIKATGEKLNGKSAVIVAKNKIFAEPLKVMLKKENINPAWIKELKKEHTNKADIVIMVLGKKYALKESMVKKGAIVIDIGINKFKGKTVGDVDFDKVKNKAGYITPVPRGIGPMTVAMLLKNTLKLAKKN